MPTRPPALEIAREKHERVLIEAAASLHAAIVELYGETDCIDFTIRAGTPFPGFACAMRLATPIDRTGLDRLEARVVARLAGAEAHAALIRLTPPNAAGRQHIEGIAWPSERQLRLDRALHDRAAECDALTVAQSFDLLRTERNTADGELLWLPAGVTALRVLEGVVRTFWRGANAEEVRGGAPPARRVWTTKRRGARDLPGRYFWFEDAAAEVRSPSTDCWIAPELDLRRARSQTRDGALSLVPPEAAAREVDEIATRATALYRALGLEVDVRRGNDPPCALLAITNRFGFVEHLAAVLRTRVGDDTTSGAPLVHVRRDGSEAPLARVESTLTGSVEGLLAALLERSMNGLPAWLAPVQVKIVPITPAAQRVAHDAGEAFAAAGLRTAIDRREESWENKVRQAVDDRVPFFAVLGDREAEGGGVDLRTRREPRVAVGMSVDAAVEQVREVAQLPSYDA